MKKIESIRNQIIKSCIKMEDLRLNQGKTGNISHRFKDGMIITPSAKDYRKIKSNELVFITQNGEFIGKSKPSIEWKFHLEIYKKITSVNSIIHNHPIFGTGFSILQKNRSLSLSYRFIWWNRRKMYRFSFARFNGISSCYC